MASWLGRLGYCPYLSGIDWNIDCPNKTGELLGERLAHVVRETRGPVIAVGHSLGGLLARFLAANFPGEVRHVIAIGSPINNPLRMHPVVSLTFRTLQALRRTGEQSSPDCGSYRCTCQFRQTVFSPLPQGVGLTSIFSKQDEVVDWRACLDPWGENREVSGQHLGLVVNREVYRILAQVLATCG
jgi:pimeloyl-ACP methyl ester carboxylesterase